MIGKPLFAERLGMRTAALGEGRAAPPRPPPEGSCDGGIRKGPPDRAIDLPDISALQGTLPIARKGGSGGRVGGHRPPRGGARERVTTFWPKAFVASGRPSPSIAGGRQAARARARALTS